MDVNSKTKLEIFYSVIKKLDDNFKIVNMSTYAKTIIQNSPLNKVNLFEKSIVK